MIGNIAIIVLVTCLTRTCIATIQIHPDVQSLLVGKGNKQILDCFVTGGQSVSANEINWAYPSGVNVTIKHKTDNANNNHSILTIDNFTTGHVGVYNCSYVSANGEINKTIRLSQIIEHKVEGDFFFGNQSAIMLCTLELPGAQLTFQEWRKNDKAISELKDNRFIDQENGTLLITKPTRSDAGPYMARYNVSGEYGPYYDCEVTFKAAPLVLDLDKSRNIVEDDYLDLICVIKGYPLFKVEWLKDGKTIVSEGDHIVMTTHNGIEKSHLYIRSVKISDGGTYTCEAIDDNGEKSFKSTIVRIKDRIEWLWPVIGIICEAIVLGIIIVVCNKIKKKHHVD